MESASTVLRRERRLHNRLERLSQLEFFYKVGADTEREIVQLKEKLSRVGPEISGPNYKRP
jgi:hypothetical protein